MVLVNKKVEHISFGLGVITKEKDGRIWVQFKEEPETKIFQYPEGFEKFLKAMDPLVEEKTLEELEIVKEQLKMERLKREREVAEREARNARLRAGKRKTKRKSTKKKS